ncbi:Spliceosomal U1 snRNP protein, putative [Candida maltosa Xu316]|uniref:U1 small nuclear ribonucleoprotein component SNU71 n=1 Tax=Candida maltosa (strain Xu316) TaxID=1245528 RepID=M3IWM5_CANMX|nr:Spliceosomal U1 snRNP protein, putative [Candida maltosa Xu316]
MDDDDEDAKLYIPIDQFKPTNLQNQLSSIILNIDSTKTLNFSKLKLNSIEKLIKVLTNHKTFSWSIINHNNDLMNLNNCLIFIKFHYLNDLKWFLETYNNKNIIDLIPGTSIIINESLEEYLKIDSTTEVPGISTTLVNKINLILNNPKNKESTTNTNNTKTFTGFEDLDQVLNSYNNYKVDNNDLIDIPNNMKDSIIKDIINFRSKMLLIEKDRRKKEIELERIKTKNKLKQLFEGIKETTSNSTNSTTAGTQQEVKLPTSDREEYEELTDEEYLQFLQNQQRKSLEDDYNAHLNVMNNKQVTEYDVLVKKLDQALTYENDYLMNNKLKFIDDLKNYEKHGLFQLYNQHYNDYLKIRSSKRALEEDRDKLDKEEELKQLAANEPPAAETSTISTPPTKKVKVETTDVIDMSKLSDDVKQLIKSKIVDLVEEYLGIKDEFLIQVITESLIDSSTTTTLSDDKKSELVNELVQVLDEDSENLVNDLWNYITSVAV